MTKNKNSSMLAVLGFVLVVVVYGAVNFFKKKNPSEEPIGYPSHVPSIVDKTLVDSPVGFGYKCMWLAVKTENKSRLAELLKLEAVSDCNWQVGIDQAYAGSVFITPPIAGWTLACGYGVRSGDTREGIDEVKTLLQTLSRELGEAQFFCTHRVVEYHCWMKAVNGQIERVYSYLGEAGENLAVEGQATAFERTLNLGNTLSEEAKQEGYFDREDLVWPDEALVMQVAEN